MEELVKTFHVDWRLMIAQLINFFIVFWVLKKFAYHPIVKVLEERAKKIKEGLENAQKAKKQLEESDRIKEQAILEAKKKSQEIIFEAQRDTEELRKQIVKKAEVEAERIVNEAQLRMEIERNEIFKDLKRQAVDMVAVGVEKVIGKTVSDKEHRELIAKVLEGIK